MSKTYLYGSNFVLSSRDEGTSVITLKAGPNETLLVDAETTNVRKYISMYSSGNYEFTTTGSPVEFIPDTTLKFANDFTQNSAGEIAYTGTVTKNFLFEFHANMITEAAFLPVEFLLYKNDVLVAGNNEYSSFGSVGSTEGYRSMNVMEFINLAQDDVLKLFLKAPSGGAVGAITFSNISYVITEM